MAVGGFKWASWCAAGLTREPQECRNIGGVPCFIWAWSLVSMAAIPIRTTESGFGQVSRVLGLLGVTRVTQRVDQGCFGRRHSNPHTRVAPKGPSKWPLGGRWRCWCSSRWFGRAPHHRPQRRCFVTKPSERVPRAWVSCMQVPYLSPLTSCCP